MTTTNPKNKEKVVLFSATEKLLRENNFTDTQIKVIEALHKGKAFAYYKNKTNAIGDICKELVLWLYFLGMKLPEDEDVLVVHSKIADLIINYFPMLNKFDLQQAIELSIADKLATDNNHYNNFSPIYVTRILNAYTEFKGGIILKYKTLLSNIEAEKHSQLTDEQKEQLSINNLVSRFSEYKATGGFTDYQASSYEYLTKNNYLQVSLDEKNEIIAEAEKKMKAMIMDDSQNSKLRQTIKLVMNDNKSYKERLKIEGRNISVKRFFKKLIDEKKDINDILKKE